MSNIDEKIKSKNVKVFMKLEDPEETYRLFRDSKKSVNFFSRIKTIFMKYWTEKNKN